VSGKIVSDGELVVGEQGEVEAEINVGTLSVSGRVTGTVHASEKIEVHPKGKVFGDLSLEKPNLIIHEGGVFEGKIEMGDATRASSGSGGADPRARSRRRGFPALVLGIRPRQESDPRASRDMKKAGAHRVPAFLFEPEFRVNETAALPGAAGSQAAASSWAPDVLVLVDRAVVILSAMSKPASRLASHSCWSPCRHCRRRTSDEVSHLRVFRAGGRA
jgi:hypothetical protein